MLFVGGLLSSAFITSGVNMLVGNVLRLEMRINKAIEDLKNRMDEIKVQFMKKNGSS